MARADRRRDARAKAAPSRGAFDRHYDSAYVGTEGLFFQRLRRQAKWMFVVLALLMGVGFVAFGVGSDVQGGIADVLGVGGGGNVVDDRPQVDDARERLEKNPNDTAALRDLSTALQDEGKLDEAVEPLDRYTTLKANDEDALRELANLYLSRATRIQGDLQIVQTRSQVLNPGQDFLPPATSPIGQALSTAPITQAVSADVNEQLNGLYSQLNAAYTDAVATYQRLARVAPDDESVQLDLADAAQRANDIPTAIAAYKQFLKLAPDSPQADLIREQIKQLEASQSALGGTGAG
jgi:tetratricopeptide (TPR) repeat protein